LYRYLQSLVDNPMLGRVYAPIPRYSCLEHESHVLFFRREEDGVVVIVRVLHERMLPEQHLEEREDVDDDP
jgi:plasmid stabilization system protein ParE